MGKSTQKKAIAQSKLRIKTVKTTKGKLKTKTVKTKKTKTVSESEVDEELDKSHLKKKQNKRRKKT